MRELPYTHSSFVCGVSNASGLKLRFETDGRIVRARFLPREEHIGFKGVVHGGILSTVLDEVMFWACVVATRQFGYCAELGVRFRNPARPREELIATGEVTGNRRGRIFDARGELNPTAGSPAAIATGKYLPIESADLPEMAADFVGDARWLLRRGE